MTEADFEREATKLLRDLGLPSDTLNFFESDSANSSNWKSTIKAPSPPKVRRVSSSGAATRRQRDRVANVTTGSLHGRPTATERSSNIPWRNSTSHHHHQSDSNRSAEANSAAKHRFSTGTPGVPSSIPMSKSQPTQSSSEQQQQAPSLPPKRHVHRPAPRAPPSNYQGASRRASTPGRSSVSPPGHAGKSVSPAASGIPVPSAASRRQSSAAVMSTAGAAAANVSGGSSGKPANLHSRPTTKAESSVNRAPAPTVGVTVRKSSAATESEQDGFHTYESVDGNATSCVTTKSSPSTSTTSSLLPKPASLKKSGPSLSVPKHQEIHRRLSAPEKRNAAEGALDSSRKSSEQSVSSTRDHKKLLQVLSTPAKTSTQKTKQTSKVDNKGTVNASKTVHAERASVLSYSRIPPSSSKTLPPPPAPAESKSGSRGTSPSSGTSTGSRIPQPGASRGGATWAGKSSRQQLQKQKQLQDKSQGETDTSVSNATYDSLSATAGQNDVADKQEEILLPEMTSKPKNANTSGVYDRLTPKELMMIMMDQDLPTEKGVKVSSEVDQKGGAKETPSDPAVHLYAKVNKRRRYSEDQETSENRHSLTSPISDPGTSETSSDPAAHLYAKVNKQRKHSKDEGTTTSQNSLTSPTPGDAGAADSGMGNLQKRKRHSADETVRSNSQSSSSNPPSRSSSRELRSSVQNGRSASIGSTVATASSSESVTDRQTPDSEERRSRINIDWSKQSPEENALNVVASSTVQALQTLVEVMTPQPSPLKTDKRFKYDNGSTSASTATTPWYLLDTEENDESSESSHPLSPSSEALMSPTTQLKPDTRTNGETNKTVATSVGGRTTTTSSQRRRSSGQMSDSSRKSSTASNSQVEPPGRKTSLSSHGSPSSRGSQGGHTSVRGETQASQSSQSGLPTPSVSRTLSSPDHDYAILEGSEHDYAILDPEYHEEFYGKYKSNTFHCSCLVCLN